MFLQPNLSRSTLLEFYERIRICLAKDDALPAGRKLYGVREYPDWRAQAREIEDDLIALGVRFQRIAW